MDTKTGRWLKEFILNAELAASGRGSGSGPGRWNRRFLGLKSEAWAQACVVVVETHGGTG